MNFLPGKANIIYSQQCSVYLTECNVARLLNVSMTNSMMKGCSRDNNSGFSTKYSGLGSESGLAI